MICSFQNAQHFENWLSGSKVMTVKVTRCIIWYDHRHSILLLIIKGKMWKKGVKMPKNINIWPNNAPIDAENAENVHKKRRKRRKSASKFDNTLNIS